jgi:DNA-binding CsgD family transcriptional regulator
MNAWRRLWLNLGVNPPGKRILALNENLAEQVEALAAIEECPVDDMLEELLALGLEERDRSQDCWHRWVRLSPREQQVTALVCLGYTNPQIATALVISPDTAKSHVRNVLRKFDVHSRGELRMLLAHWDFSAWLA